MNTTVQKWGNSQGIRLPKHLLEAMKWREDEQLDIEVEEGRLVIEKATEQKRKNIKELFANFEGQYEPISIDWGKPTGKEIW